MRRVPVAPITALVLGAASCPRSARAHDARAEARAKKALVSAEGEYASGSSAHARALLDAALAGCGKNGCTDATKAALLRDRGSLDILLGATADGTASMDAAHKLAPGLALDETYATPEVRAAWQSAPTEAPLVQPPDGDFTLVPIREQAENTPVPIYVEIAGGSPPARVVVKYKSASMTAFRPVVLSKSGNGWSGLLPCADVTLGVLRYYVQGFDADGEPILSSGDPRHPYSLRVRASITGPAPHLPGRPAPIRCAAGGAPEAAVVEPAPDEARTKLDDGASCQRDEECTSGSCAGVCTSEVRSRNRFPRVWLGVSASLEYEPMASGNDVCKLDASGSPISSGFYCTTPDGNDFPSRSDGKENATLTAGHAGTTTGAFGPGNIRVMASADYALTQHALVGVRIGYVFDTNPGSAARSDGKSFFAPLHLEARGTFLFGTDPLQRAGFRPVVIVNLGAAAFDEDTTVLVQQTGIAGSRPVQAWRSAGPFFLGAGAGLRLAVSPYHALTTILKVEGALGSSGFTPIISPELGAQVGF